MDDDTARRHMHLNGALLAADGTPRLPHVAYDDDGYAYNDGAPLAQNDAQAEQLYYAFPALKRFARGRFPGAYVASDMFVYPAPRSGGRAPDIFVAFGAGQVDPKGRRRNSYKLFEGEPVPSFVLEVLSGTTADDDLGVKRDAYARWGVREYWMFDPLGEKIPRFISAERLEGGEYARIDPLPGTGVYRSDVLCLEFRAENGGPAHPRPGDGRGPARARRGGRSPKGGDRSAQGRGGTRGCCGGTGGNRGCRTPGSGAPGRRRRSRASASPAGRPTLNALPDDQQSSIIESQGCWPLPHRRHRRTEPLHSPRATKKRWRMAQSSLRPVPCRGRGCVPSVGRLRRHPR